MPFAIFVCSASLLLLLALLGFGLWRDRNPISTRLELGCLGLLGILWLALGAFLGSSDAGDSDVECFSSADSTEPAELPGCTFILLQSVCVSTNSKIQSTLRRSTLSTEFWKRFHSSMSYSSWRSSSSSFSSLCDTTSGATVKYGQHPSLPSHGSPDAMHRQANSPSQLLQPPNGPIRHGPSAQREPVACRRNDRRCRSRDEQDHRIGRHRRTNDPRCPRRGLHSHETTSDAPLPRGGTRLRATRHPRTCTGSPTHSPSLRMSERQRGRCETSTCGMHRPGGDATMRNCYDLDEARFCWTALSCADELCIIRGFKYLYIRCISTD